MIRLSVVVPVYSGQKYLERLVAELQRLRSGLEERTGGLVLAESIFVLDGAIDESEAVLLEMREKHDWIRVISLSRNFGQHNATVAGILHSSGDWVVTLDEDLQHPPGRIPALLLQALEHRADVVLAIAQAGSHGRSYRDVLSRVAKRLVGLASGNDLVARFSSFRLIRGQVARAAASVCSHQTYFDIALGWFTQRIHAFPMTLTDLRFTASGTSGYSIRSLLGHAKRLITSSDLHLFRMSVLVSGLSFALTVLLGVWVILSYLLVPGVAGTRGWASLMGAIVLYGGIVSLLLGLVLEIVKINMFQSQGKPTFFVVDRASDAELARYAHELETLLAE